MPGILLVKGLGDRVRAPYADWGKRAVSCDKEKIAVLVSSPGDSIPESSCHPETSSCLENRNSTFKPEFPFWLFVPNDYTPNRLRWCRPLGGLWEFSVP